MNKLIKISFGLIGLILLGDYAFGAWTYIGNVSTYTVTEDTVTFTCGTSKIKIIFYTDDMVRIWLAPDGNFTDPVSTHLIIKNDWPGANLEISEVDNYIKMETDEFVLRVNKNPFRLSMYKKDNLTLIWKEKDLGGLGYDGSKSCEYFDLPSDEHFYGLGMNFENLDHRGEKAEAWTNVSTYAPNGNGQSATTVPFFMSSKGYGIFNNTAKHGYYNFGQAVSTENYWYFTENRFDYFCFYGPDLKKVLTRYMELTGKPPLPPKWYLYFMYCQRTTQDNLINIADTFRSKHIPCGAMMTDINWMIGKPPDWVWSSDFPDPQQFIIDLKNRNFRLVNWILSHVHEGASCYNYAVTNNYTLRHTNGTPYLMSVGYYPGNGALTDFSYPAANEWWKDRLNEYLITEGLDGFFLDGGGQLQVPASDCINWAGLNADEMHNLFSIFYTSAVFYAIEDNTTNRGLVRRSIGGWSGVQRYAIQWTGDNTESWDRVKWHIRVLQTAGLSGLGYIDQDMGGIYGSPTGELYARDAQATAFQPFTYGQRNKEPWRFGTEAENITRFYFQLRSRLEPYIYNCFYESSQTGIPIMRAMVLEYPQDSNFYDNTHQYQYMFGDKFLVAPIYTEGATSRTIRLPEGKWVDYWTGQEYDGSQMINYTDAPTAKLPLLVKKGAIIPMGHQKEYLEEKPGDVLTLDIYPHQNSSTFLYEDDGITKNYRDGEYCITHYECLESTNIIQINISTRSNSYTPEARSYMLKINGMWEPVFVTKDGNGLTKHTSYSNLEAAESGWYYGVGPVITGVISKNSNSDTIWIKFPDNGQEMHIVISQVSEPDHLECVANPDTIIANGNDTSLVAGYVKDEYGNIIETATHTITFSISGEGTWNDGTTEDKVIQAENGVANITVKSTVHQGSMTVIATTPGLTEDSVTIQTIAGPATKILLSAQPASIVADNIDISTITATIVDTNNNRCYPAANEITFNTDLGYLVGQNPQNAVGGQAYIILKSTKTGTATLGATSTGLIQGTTNVEILPGEAIKINLDAQPTEIIADGISISTITAKISDEYDNLCWTRTDEITFGVNEYGVLIGTNPQSAIGGIAKIQMQSTNVPGVAEVSAQALGLNSGTVNVITTGLKIELEASSLTIIANNEDTCLIKATIKDQYGYKVDTATNIITFSCNKGELVGTNPVSCIDGETEILLKTIQAGVIRITANSEDLAGDNIEITAVAGEPTKIILSAEPENIVANGIDISTITAKIIDINGNLVKDATNVIRFTKEGKGHFLGPSEIEAQNGIAEIILNSDYSVEEVIINAYSEGLSSDTIKINFLPGPLQNIVLVPNPSQIVGDGVSSSTLTAILVDAYNNKVPIEKEIDFTCSGTVTFLEETTYYSTITLDGETSILVVSTQNLGEGKITAKIMEDSISSCISIYTVIGPPRKISCQSNKEKILSDGTEKAVISAFIADAGGHKINNSQEKEILFEIISGEGILKGQNPVFTVGGEAQIEIVALQPGSLQIQAKAQGLDSSYLTIDSFLGKLSIIPWFDADTSPDGAIYIPGKEVNIAHSINLLCEIKDQEENLITTIPILLKMKAEKKEGYLAGEPLVVERESYSQNGKVTFENVEFPNPGIYELTVYGSGVETKSIDVAVVMSFGEGGIIEKKTKANSIKLFVSPWSFIQWVDPIIVINTLEELKKEDIYRKIEIANNSAKNKVSVLWDRNLFESSLCKIVASNVNQKPLTLDLSSEPEKRTQLELFYLDVNNDNIVDGTNIEEKCLKVFKLDENNCEWIEIEESLVVPDSNKITFYLDKIPTSCYCIMGVREEGELIISNLVNYPNPFKDKTRFIFDLGCSADIKIKIYTVSGRLIKEINYNGLAGYNEIEWDGKDQKGKEVANGVYLYKVIADKENKKIEKIQKLIKIQ